MKTKFIDVSRETKKGKKTVFTEVLDRDDGWIDYSGTPSDFQVVKYLGHCLVDGDMFAVYEEESIDIYKGTKGDEFE